MRNEELKMKKTRKTEAKTTVLDKEVDSMNLPKTIPNMTEISLVEAKKFLPEYMRHLENISPREYKFLAVYCSNGFNAIDACEKAGYAERSRAKYRAIAYTLLNRKEISEAIKLYIDHVIEPYKARLEFEILDIYYRRATYLVTEFYDDFGNPKPLKDIGKEWLCCIDQIDVKVSGNGNVQRNFTLPNRDFALQALYKFITGQEINSTQTLPEESRKNITKIYNTVIQNSKITPKMLRKKNEVR